MITVNDISVQFSGTTLFSEVSFAINENDKIALMGKNGAGKSTLLKIIAGQSKPSTGSISAPKDAVVAYLPQHLLTTDGATVMEETSKAFGEIFKMKAEIDELNEQLTVRTDYESDEYMKLIERVSDLSEKYYAIEEVNYEEDQRFKGEENEIRQAREEAMIEEEASQQEEEEATDREFQELEDTKAYVMSIMTDEWYGPTKQGELLCISRKARKKKVNPQFREDCPVAVTRLERERIAIKNYKRKVVKEKDE
jgi:ABC-type cobalamin/Fe3+-siderophores transport system ATPase subunit